MQVKSKRGDEVRLYCDLEERVEIGELIEISEEDRSVVVQILDIEQDSELILSGEKGREVLAKIRLEGIGGESRVYKEWSGWFPSTPVLVKKVSASRILAPNIWQESLPLGYERNSEELFQVSLQNLRTLNIVAGFRSENLLATLAAILCLKGYRVIVFDSTGRFAKLIRRSFRERFRRFTVGDEIKLPIAELGGVWRDFLSIYGWTEPLITMFDSVYKSFKKSKSLSFKSIVRELSLRKDTELFVDFLCSLNEVLTDEHDEINLGRHVILDLSKCDSPSALLTILHRLIKQDYNFLLINNIQALHVPDLEKLARLLISKKDAVFIDIGVDTEASVLLRYAVNLFFTGPYNRLLEDLFPLLENEEPLLRKLSSEEFLINGFLTKNTPVILTMLRPEDFLG